MESTCKYCHLKNIDDELYLPLSATVDFVQGHESLMPLNEVIYKKLFRNTTQTFKKRNANAI